VDFYAFACGGWRKANPIPADQTRWGRFNELAEGNREELREILEKAPAAARSKVEAKVATTTPPAWTSPASRRRGLGPFNRCSPGWPPSIRKKPSFGCWDSTRRRGAAGALSLRCRPGTARLEADDRECRPGRLAFARP
jgi:Peptidase family M13